MAEKSIEQRVKEVIVNSLNVSEDKVTDDASFLEDLGADSLSTVELMMAFEDEFENEIEGGIPEEDAEKLLTVKDVVNYIKSRLA
ncbi:MAG: acyl carrier protein [Verrucomicrobiota bacterium]|nr:acyl carrier protein [Opitutales bacterium]UPA28159.1 MAG: acyl carrier protein [Verrucomicrobiota bacterium]